MDSSILLSAASKRAFDSPISDLMSMALQRPDVISLAAGFVDHATLPVGSVGDTLAQILQDDMEGRRSLQYGTTRGDLKLRHRLLERLVGGRRDHAGNDLMRSSGGWW